ncbi:MAG: regulatory iron-sulfur-containing complex subunit RicT [Deltaproteobacteria bacterium]|nr:regulatory iron-sulfur-containing complex subunit RicT [Deltaproteobacteria bacterium]
MLKIVGIKFQEWGKIYSFDAQAFDLKQREKVIVETESGLSFGAVKLEPYEAGEKEPARGLKKVLRKATDEDFMQIERNREKEIEAFNRCRDIIEKMNLCMKLVNVEYLFDGSKAIFYFTAEERVDFRELVKDLACQLHIRIEMRQIGVRDEAKKKGAVGPCGRMLCCSTWITSFEPVSVKMAKKQGLSLNPANISGMCGRLMCCLSYEYQNYVDGMMTPVSPPPVVPPEPAKEKPRVKQAPPKKEAARQSPKQADTREKSGEQKNDNNGSDKNDKKNRFRRKKKRWRKKTNEQ